MAFAGLDDETRERLKGELLKIREAAIADKRTIEKQAARIKSLEATVADAHRRLIEIRREVLVESACQTGKTFRDHVKKQLQALRDDFESLRQQSGPRSVSGKPAKLLGRDCKTPAAAADDGADDEKKEDVKSAEPNDLPSTIPFKTPAANASPLLKTSQYTAAARAMESARVGKDRLFSDPFASAFAGDYGPSFLNGFAKEMNVGVDYLAAFVAFRTKYIDDRILEGQKKGVNQVVVLRAGSDTRAYRLDELSDKTTFFYVDTAQITDYRTSVFKSAKPKCNVVNVATDATGDSLKDELAKNGFKSDSPAVFIVEGVIPYLPAKECNSFLTNLASLMPAGSVLVGDIPNQTNVDLKILHDAWANFAERVVFGQNVPEEFFNGFGLKKEDLTFLGHGRSNYKNRSTGEFLAHMDSAPPSKNDTLARIYLFCVTK